MQPSKVLELFSVLNFLIVFVNFSYAIGIISIGVVCFEVWFVSRQNGVVCFEVCQCFL